MWDTPYGNYNEFDPPPRWYDDFTASKAKREDASWKFKEAVRDVLDEIADDNDLLTDEWTDDDYEVFRDIMDL